MGLGVGKLNVNIFTCHQHFNINVDHDLNFSFLAILTSSQVISQSPLSRSSRWRKSGRGVLCQPRACSAEFVSVVTRSTSMSGSCQGVNTRLASLHLFSSTKQNFKNHQGSLNVCQTQSSKLTDAKTLNACKKCQLRLQILEQGKILHLDIGNTYSWG